MDELLKHFVYEKFPECNSIEFAKNTKNCLYIVGMRGYYGANVSFNIRSTDKDSEYQFLISTIKPRGGFLSEETKKTETFKTTSELADLLDKYFEKKTAMTDNRTMFDLYTEIEYFFGADNVEKCVVLEDTLSISTEEVDVDVRKAREGKFDVLILIGKENHFRMSNVAGDDVANKVQKLINSFYTTSSLETA